MELNDKEQKMLAWLNKQDAAWPIIRWIILVCSVLCLFVFFFKIYTDLVLLVVGAVGLSYTLGSWAGRAEVSLLLKLVNENIEPNDKNT